MPYDLPTWDLTSELAAVRLEAGYFGRSRSGGIWVDEEGFTHFRAEDSAGTTI